MKMLDYSQRSRDLNGDGFADLVIGAPVASPNGTWSGASYVVYGKLIQIRLILAQLQRTGIPADL